jgi:hypothetical protein
MAFELYGKTGLFPPGSNVLISSDRAERLLPARVLQGLTAGHRPPP